jgi:DNA-binding CsgD family transcriptional regulator
VVDKGERDVHNAERRAGAQAQRGPRTSKVATGRQTPKRRGRKPRDPQGKGQREALVRAALALGLVFGWILSLALAGPLVARAEPSSLGPLSPAEAFALVHGLSLVTVGVAAARVPHLERLLPWGGPLTAILGLAIAASPSHWWSPILAAAGATSAAAVLAVAGSLAALGLRHRAWAVASGALVANVPLYLAALPEHPLPDRPLAVALALALLSLPLLIGNTPPIGGHALEWAPFLSLLVALWGIYLVGGLMYGMLAPGLGAIGQRMGVLPYMALLPVSALAVTRLGTSWLGRVGPALLGLGFAASALFSGAGRDVTAVMAVVGAYAFMDVFFWTVLGQQGQPHLAYALGLGAMVMAIFTGMALGGPVSELAKGREDTAALVAAMALLIAMAAFPWWQGAPAPVLSGTDGEVPTSPDLASLSQREMEVLRLVARGLSNKEVARELELSQATVRKHLERIYRKLEVRGRAAAVARILEQEGIEGELDGGRRSQDHARRFRLLLVRREAASEHSYDDASQAHDAASS